jgi:hypothetical protein
MNNKNQLPKKFHAVLYEATMSLHITTTRSDSNHTCCIGDKLLNKRSNNGYEYY